MSDFLKLYNAVYNNDYDLLYRLIYIYKIDVNIKDEYNKTVLHYANDEKIVRLLLDGGAKIYYELLLFIYYNNKYQILIYILLYSKFHNPNLISYNDLNKLFKLCVSGENIKLVEILIKCGVDVNIVYMDTNNTPLIIACETKNLKLIKLLIDNGSDINFKYGYDDSVLFNIISFEYYNVIKLLINNGADVNITDMYEDTPLTFACYNENNIEIVKLLLNNGSNINHMNCYNESGLIISCVNNNYEIAKLLINFGSDLGISEQSALYASCISDSNDEIIILLINSGSDVNEINNDGESLFIISCGNNNFRIMKILLAAGCYYDINDNCVKQHIIFINNYLNSDEYNEYYYKLNINKSSLIFSNVVLLSDEYLRFK